MDVEIGVWGIKVELGITDVEIDNESEGMRILCHTGTLRVGSSREAL